jgi:PTS system nitrogen regulatory IIA component
LVKVSSCFAGWKEELGRSDGRLAFLTKTRDNAAESVSIPFDPNTSFSVQMEDLDVSRLAEYLHVTPDQVIHMAVRGRIPARRVGGGWRFNEAEIHHWLEDRIGASNMDELTKVQRVVDRVTGEVVDRPLSDLCTQETIAVPLNARTRGSVIRAMCELASRSGLMWDAPAMAEAVQAREQMHPTALDCGVALLHPRRPQTSILADSVVSMAVCPSSIPFSDRGHSTDIFFLICSYDDSSHLRILAKLSRMIEDGELLHGLRSCESVGDAWTCLKESEEAVDSAMH